MRPITKSQELGSVHQVIDYMHNTYIQTMKAQAAEIKSLVGLVAACSDMWSSPNNKTLFMGTNGAYIVIKQRKNKRPQWILKSTILGFCRVKGAHDGENLGRYLFSVFRRAGIIDVERKISRVHGCTIWSICVA